MTKLGNVQTSGQKNNSFNLSVMYALGLVHEKVDV